MVRVKVKDQLLIITSSLLLSLSWPRDSKAIVPYTKIKHILFHALFIKTANRARIMEQPVQCTWIILKKQYNPYRIYLSNKFWGEDFFHHHLYALDLVNLDYSIPSYRTRKRTSVTSCSWNIVFFRRFLNIPDFCLSLFSHGVSVCIHTR